MDVDLIRVLRDLTFSYLVRDEGFSEITSISLSGTGKVCLYFTSQTPLVGFWVCCCLFCCLVHGIRWNVSKLSLGVVNFVCVWFMLPLEEKAIILHSSCMC